MSNKNQISAPPPLVLFATAVALVLIAIGYHRDVIHADANEMVIDQNGGIKTLVVKEPGYDAPLALRFEAPLIGKDTPVLVFVNGKLVSLAKRFEGAPKGPKGIIDLGPIELLLGDDAKKVKSGDYTNGYVWVKSGDRLLLVVDINGNNKQDEDEPSSEVNLSYTAAKIEKK